MDPRAARIEWLESTLRQRIVLFDGANGTLAQGLGLSESDFRGTDLKDVEQDLAGNIDILNLTQPALVGEIHGKYFAAGADIVKTNSFTANAPSQADFGLENLVPQINLAAARIAREVADEWHKKDRRSQAGSWKHGPDQPHALALSES